MAKFIYNEIVLLFFVCWLCAPRLFVAWRWKGWTNARASGARSCRYINTLLRESAQKGFAKTTSRTYGDDFARRFYGRKIGLARAI